MKMRGALWRLIISAAVTVFLIVLVSNVIRQPVASETRSYAAMFTDASGLNPDADVRVRGVRVGKVSSIDLLRQNGQSLAQVNLTVDRKYGIVASSKLAIKYAALTGVRYVELQDPADGYSANQLVTRIPAAMTQPSFDITALFNGLEPVISTLNPDELNVFASNAAEFLAGDGTGLAPVLESVRTLTQFVSQRQDVVATLMSNLAALSNAIGGKSRDFIQLIDWLNRPIDNALVAIDEFRKSELYGPQFTEPAKRLINNLGFVPGIDVDRALDRAVTNFDNFADAFKLMPVIWENIPPPGPEGGPEPCSRGPAQLPVTMDVLLNGRRVVLCNK